MSTENTYEGWTNRETWLIKLWIDNDQGEADYWATEAADHAAELVSDAIDDASAGEENRLTAIYTLSKALESYYDVAVQSLTGVWADLMTGALARVNWREIATSMVEDAVEANA
jgi:predicted RNase H-like HicB family nuclease